VSPRGDLRVVGHGHVPFGDEFDVLKEHVEGLIHQAYGEDKNFEPVDGEAQQAVAAAQQAASEPKVVDVLGVVVTVDPATGATTETPGDTVAGDGTGTALPPASDDDGTSHLDTTPEESD